MAVFQNIMLEHEERPDILKAEEFLAGKIHARVEFCKQENKEVHRDAEEHRKEPSNDGQPFAVVQLHLQGSCVE